MTNAASDDTFRGKFFMGSGDVEYLQLLDAARRMFSPDPELQNVAMLYQPAWNGLVEGPTWGAWWIQNSYGPTYCALPFYEEPFVTFLQNSQDLWFDQMGDGKRVGAHNWVAPDGCLCDAAAPGWIVYRQGDGRIDIHDWGIGFTAAGLLMQCEALLISRDYEAIERYLPRLERCANFLESRRDPKNNLMLAGPAGNLLAPSYAGYKQPDGTYGMAYLAELSVTTIAALDRLIELEKLADADEKVALYSERRDLLRQGLPAVTTDEGYFIRSLDPDGTRHGVFGAEKHGYFEVTPNQDALCFGVVDDAQARRIFAKIASIPELRPHDFIIPNYPSYDDMYEQPRGLWGFGTWVNGGHWSTCEARMVMGYYRLGQYEDARKSMRQLMTFARRFRMDNPLVKFGSDVYQPNEPINLTYDAFGPAAAFVRGLFEYRYDEQGLTLVPHIPPSIRTLYQRFPIRLGASRIYVGVERGRDGGDEVSAVSVNGQPWPDFDGASVRLYEWGSARDQRVVIRLGRGEPYHLNPNRAPRATSQGAVPAITEDLAELSARAKHFRLFARALQTGGLGDTYEAAHARLIGQCVAAALQRRRLQAAGRLVLLSEPSQTAADASYAATATRLMDGLAKALKGYAASDDGQRGLIYAHWKRVAEAPGWINIRSEGSSQSFRKREGAMRMTMSGQPKASCGWAKDLETPLTLPAGAKLVVEISGSPNARYFVDLMAPDGHVVSQTLWHDTPQERQVVEYGLPEGRTVGQAILYLMTQEGPAWDDWWRVRIVDGQGRTLVALVGE